MSPETKAACEVLCLSGKFETGEGTCALICMDLLGDARRKRCSHMYEVHLELASAIVKAVGLKA
jgi:hypothetical protein